MQKSLEVLQDSGPMPHSEIVPRRLGSAGTRYSCVDCGLGRTFEFTQRFAGGRVHGRKPTLADLKIRGHDFKAYADEGASAT